MKRLKISNQNPSNTLLAFGLSTDEQKRKFYIRKYWRNREFDVVYPRVNDQEENFCKIKKYLNRKKIEIPRLYEFGFKHNNCGGGCVKAGIHQWKLLYECFLERYEWHENQEMITRQIIGKDVSILRDRSGVLQNA